MVVEDDRAVAEALSELLIEEGFAVEVARDGHAALEQLARGARPDVILLDLMMPGLDGYHFRRRQLADADLAGIPTVALSAGAVDHRLRDLQLSGWMRKPVALDALLATVRRVGGLDDQPHEHLVHFYRSDEALVEQVTAFVAEGIGAGEAAVAIATGQHRAGLRAALALRGVDVSVLEARGQLLLLDAAETLERLLVRGAPDRGRFEGIVGPALDRLLASSSSGRLRAYGEMVNLLWRRGDIASAIALESLWNHFGRSRPFSLLCAYFSDGATADPRRHRAVLCQHSGEC
jgi:CheY-like chemotaxis protein